MRGWGLLGHKLGAALVTAWERGCWLCMMMLVVHVMGKNAGLIRGCGLPWPWVPAGAACKTGYPPSQPTIRCSVIESV